MTSVNLIPERILAVQMRQRHVKRWTLLILAAAGLTALPLLLDWSRQAHAAELRAESDRLQRELGTTRSKLQTTATEATKVLLEVERAKALRSKRAWSGMFALIASCMPADCWLASVATDPQTPTGGAAPRSPLAQPKPTSAEPEIVIIEAPRKLRMIGYAESDAQALALVTNLKGSRVFQSVLLERTARAPDATQGQSEASGKEIYQFEVVCEW